MSRFPSCGAGRAKSNVASVTEVLHGIVPKSLRKSRGMQDTASTFTHMPNLSFDHSVRLRSAGRRCGMRDTQRACRRGKLGRGIRVQQLALRTMQEMPHGYRGRLSSLVLQWVASTIPCGAIIYKQGVTIATGRTTGLGLGHDVVGRDLLAEERRSDTELSTVRFLLHLRHLTRSTMGMFG